VFISFPALAVGALENFRQLPLQLNSVQGVTASTGNFSMRKEHCAARKSRKPQHTAKIFSAEARAGKQSPISH